MSYLLLTVRFLDDRYHGLLDRGGPPEWPPSPFRLFQALVAGVARRGELVDGDDICPCTTCRAARKHRGVAKAGEPIKTAFKPIGQALDWLQRYTRESPPIIIAPKSKRGQAITRFVPNNDGDKKGDRQERLTAKHTEPTLFVLEPDQKPEVHFVWDINDAPDAPVGRIRDAARSLTTLGWGIDMAFADARLCSESEIGDLHGIRWYPKKNAGSFQDTLRTPTYDEGKQECTLCDLRHCHSTFINRIEHGKPLKTVEKPKVFDRVLYTSVERPIRRPHAVFKLLDANEDTRRYSHAKLIHVAGMTRHIAIERMKADPPPPGLVKDPSSWLETFVCGHRGDQDRHQQISYVPLPSVGHLHADAGIRNVLLIAPLGREDELEYVAERINGEALKPEHKVRSIDLEHSSSASGPIFLHRFTPPPDKFIATCYLGRSKTWQTVIPVILDGHNKKSKADKPAAIARQTEKLIRKALARAGIETPCEFTWQSIPFLKNCLSAHKYDRNGRHTGYHRPAHLKHQTAVHVQLTFNHPVPGPITIGAGRHCGFGLMMAVDH